MNDTYINCECGSLIKKCSKPYHSKTKKHIYAMNKIKDDEYINRINKKAWKAYERAFGRKLNSFIIYGKKEIVYHLRCEVNELKEETADHQD